MCPSLGVLERLSGVPIKQRSSSAPVSFSPKRRELAPLVGCSLLSPFEGSPFEAFAPGPADAGATVLSRVAERDMGSARDMVCTAPSARRARPRAAFMAEIQSRRVCIGDRPDCEGVRPQPKRRSLEAWR